MPDAKWLISIVAPDDTEDHGSITLLSIEMGSKEIADRMAEIAWRLTHDLSEAWLAGWREPLPPGELLRERVVE